MMSDAFQQMIAACMREFAPYCSGNALGTVLALKGRRGLAEEAGEPPVSGADGVALEKALVALGYGPDAWCGVLTCPLGCEPLTVDELLNIVETLDPRVVIVLDRQVNTLLDTSDVRLEDLGHRMVGLEDFEAALADEGAKRAAWRQLKQLQRDKCPV